MKSKTVIVSIVLLALLANSNIAVAQKANDSAREWGAVKALAAGERMIVRLKDGKKLEGTLRSVSDTQLVLNRGNNSADLNRDSVSKVYRLVPRSAARSVGKSAAIGAGIGFGAGAAVGVAGGSYEDLETAELVGFLGGLGAAIGAGIGAFVGALYVKPRRELIYEVK
jgi:ferric-dicitrate binding protein FerR (iron transport regulator)